MKIIGLNIFFFFSAIACTNHLSVQNDGKEIAAQLFSCTTSKIESVAWMTKAQKEELAVTRLSVKVFKGKPQKDEWNFSEFLNHTNNMLTVFAIIVAIFTLIAAIAGFFVYLKVDKMKEDIENLKLSTRISEEKIDKMKEDIESLKLSTQKSEEKINKNNEDFKNQREYFKNQREYFYLSSNCIYEAINNFIANPGVENFPKTFLKIEEAKIFSIREKEQLSALMHFYGKGTEEHLENLQFLVDKDDSVKVRNRASEIIGIIKHKRDTNVNKVNDEKKKEK